MVVPKGAVLPVPSALRKLMVKPVVVLVLQIYNVVRIWTTKVGSTGKSQRDGVFTARKHSAEGKRNPSAGYR